ncbi:MAG: PhoH family protein [Myxococcales bacterium]|nr:PhoH family protein [Myxococcales bacterium]
MSFVTSAPVCLPGNGVRSGSWITGASEVDTARSLHVEPKGPACYLPLLTTPGGNASPPVTERVTLDDNDVALVLYGERNANLKHVERETGTQLHARGNELTFVGAADAVAVARRLVEQLYAMARAGTPIGGQDIGRAAAALRSDAGVDLHGVFNDTILVAGRARPIAPKGLAQKRYVDAIRTHDLVFGVGPAGTG